MNLKSKVLLFFLSFIPFGIMAQLPIVKDGKPQTRIVVNQADSTDLQAANLMQDFVKRISGAEISIVSSNSKIKKGDILIGSFQEPIKSFHRSELKEDGFFLSTQDGYIRVIGEEGKGTIYGVVTLLEDYLGVRYYAENLPMFTISKDIMLPETINKIDNPSFRYRQTQAYSIKDPIYKLWHRLEEPKEVFAGNLWVHTFNSILPAAKYGKSNPEYYAFINGERRPGTASQWCLTNPEVLEIVSVKIDSIFKANPDKKIISVSQNDSQNHCQCDNCKAIDEREGSPSGTLIYFMNKLAERFPDKEFSTLAYLYSVAPPKYIKPLPNVNIMLCDIDCYREVTLTENPSGQTFVRDMEGWSKISNNIFVWDYGINFDNYISPFPNFHILKPNMNLFKENNATMHFSQIGGVKGTDFSELRSYLVAKLLWNTEADTEAIIKSFLNDYYGEAAAPYLYQYIKLREGALIGSNKPLWIYDTPITHKNGMLNTPMMKRYKILFDEAEKAVANSPEFLNRVREARLPIQYAELEIARTEPIENVTELKSKLNAFRNTAKELNVIYLNERNNTIEDYCDLYEQRNLPKERKSLAHNAKITFITPPSAPYDKIGDTALTDGLYGGATYNESWVGWISKDAEFIIDLGQVKEIETVEFDFLHQLGAWILLPKSVTCQTSIDNKDFVLMGHKDIPEDRDTEVKYVNIPIRSDQKIKAHYIKVKIESIGLCPPWHYGVGFPAWFFLDEVSVY
ncbi:glycosyl hydrolase family 67 [Dysgonomonas alginatilytica]|uniref:Glycosyl hydrolase family 67 n=1 Tax=Dysgonomonas alginatilytica TaxID=1605892 RepID=A0A2V3PK31_9BACT|nr:DUF4838 domain-containing protein [Dysgonomonas alginatilytica]PXV57170.1 glycosyl hydrolase family 67 [Dysgonomonas alginatilytica]